MTKVHDIMSYYICAFSYSKIDTEVSCFFKSTLIYKAAVLCNVTKFCWFKQREEMLV